MTYSAYKKPQQVSFPEKERGKALNIQSAFTPKFTHIKAHAFFCILGLIVFLYMGLKVLDYTKRYQDYETITTGLVNKALHLASPKLTAQEATPQTATEQDNSQGEDIPSNTPQAWVEIPEEGKEGEQVNSQDDTLSGTEKSAQVHSKKSESLFDPLGITSHSQVRLLESLGARHQELEKIKHDLDRRELELKLYEKKLQEKHETINTIQEEIKRQLGELDKAEIVKQKSLSEVFSIMNPKAAAAIFDKHTMPVVMEIIRHMKERKLSEILSFVSVDRAKEITEELAMRSESLAQKGQRGNISKVRR